MNIKTTTADYHLSKEWDAIEVNPVQDVGDDCAEQCEPEEADYWSVYLHLTEGGLQWVADLETQADAEQFALVLEKIAQLYKKQ